MNKYKVEAHIRNAIDTAKRYHPKKIFKGLKIAVYSGSFGWITITISSDYATASGYVGNYDAVNDKIADFLHRASFNLYEAYYNKHHKARA